MLVRWLQRLALALVILITPAELWAKPATRIDVTEVTLAKPEPNHRAREKQVGRQVRSAAHKAAKSLNFGDKKRVEVSFEVLELSVEQQGDVVRVSCTILGKLRGGGTARSRLSFGGKPERRKALERQVIGMVTEGVVTRLAEMSRQRTEEKANGRGGDEASELRGGPSRPGEEP